MALTIFISDRFADHVTPPGHPERVERFEVMKVVVSEFRERGVPLVEPRAATENELARVHDRDYLLQIRETSGRAVALDLDTVTSPDSYEVALLAAGAAVSAVDHVLDAPPGACAMAVVRPPGHHAERHRAMGFCLFNNIAIGAAHARARGLARVAVVDFDVHHGNGTQWSFYDDPSVLFVSSHQYPFYPGTGAADEVGRGDGAGFTVNLPLEAGCTDGDYELVSSTVVVPVLEQFKPELILVSAGYDAHMDDPLGGMRLTTEQFARMTSSIVTVAEQCCGGRVVAVTEGGYDLKALAGSLRATMNVLDGEVVHGNPFAPPAPTRRGPAALEAVRPHVTRYWTL